MFERLFLLRRRYAKIILVLRSWSNFISHRLAGRNDRIKFGELERRLDLIGCEVEKEYSDQIPNVLHFVFLYPLHTKMPFYTAVAIQSAITRTGATRTFLYCSHEPLGDHWDAIKAQVTIIYISDFTYFKNAKIYHAAHKADIIRLLALYHIGGIYLDNDTITLRSMDDLRDKKFVMGIQGTRGGTNTIGLCNATMLGRRHSLFCNTWIRSYRFFKSKGRDTFWDFHSVKLPVLIARALIDEITVLSSRAFFYPMWHDIERRLFTDGSRENARYFESAYSIHLWSSMNGFLPAISRAYIQNSSSLYASWAQLSNI